MDYLIIVLGITCLFLYIGIFEPGSARLQDWWSGCGGVLFLIACGLDWFDPVQKAVAIEDYGYAVGFSLGMNFAIAIFSFLVTILLLALRKVVKAVDSDD